MIITVVCSQRENITFDQSLFLLPVWPCRKTKDTWYWNVFQKNETDCSTVTLMSCSGLDHPLLQQLPHHQTDPKCINEEHKNCTMKTDFYSLWSKWYWPEFHHKIPLILLFSKYMKLFEIWFILWSLKFCFKISINWFMAFFFKCWWEKIWQRLSLATVQASHKIRVSLYYKLGIVYSSHHVRFREGDWPHPILSFFLTIPHPFGTNFFLFLFFPFYKNHRWQL